jgi:DNA-binding transcriptional LysR family regulator
MDPTKKLRDIWAWIPVFRVVAETEHLPTAAARLHVSPSALSRTVRLVEDTLGEELFVRTSRKIVLNSAGKRLLESVRRSMTALERGLTDALEHDFAGEYRISSLGVLTDCFVLPALLQVREARPKLIPCMTTLSSREANRQLASGLIEVAFYYDATSMPGVVCEKIGTLANSLYCGKAHPLFGKKRVSSQELAEHEFSVAAIGDRGTPMDGWPVELPRRIGFQILMLSTNLRVSLSGRFVTVLPDVVAAPDFEAGRLWRLEPELVPDTDVYAACREEDAGTSFTAEVISEVGKRIALAPRGDRGPRRPPRKRAASGRRR